MSKKIEDDWSLVDKAQEMRDAGDYDGAINIYTQLLSQYPVAELYNERGVSYSARGDYQDAVVDFTDAIGIASTDSDYYVNRANAYLKLKAFDAALEDYNEAIILNPYTAHAYNGRGYVYVTTGLIDNAIEDYNRAISLDQSYVAPRYNLGLLYYGIQSYAEAIVQLEAALTIQPDDPAILSLSDAAREALGDNTR